MKKVLFVLVALFGLTFGLTSCTECSSDVIIGVTNGLKGDMTLVSISSQAVQDYVTAISKECGGSVSSNYVILKSQSSEKKAKNAAKSGAESVKKQLLSKGITVGGVTYKLQEVSSVETGCFSVTVNFSGFDNSYDILTHYYKVN